ncbi:MAG: response regulator [Desulfobacterales bacterium]
MMEKTKIRVHLWDQMVLIGFGLALFYTVFDSVLYIFLSYDVDFFQRLLGPDISAIWSRVSILCLFIIFGSHAQFTINQRTAAEAALRESEEKFRTIIETAPDGYYEIDPSGNFTFFNDSMCKIVGYSRNEIAALNQLELLDEANSQKLKDVFNQVLGSGKPVTSLAWTLSDKNRSLRFLESSVSLIKDPKGNPVGFGGFIRDVTQRQRAEVMYRAKLAAEAASRTKSEFLASMSHEIRTPLNAIIGLVELMLTSDLPPDQREDLDVVKSSAYSLLSIINNILDFSKIEAGRLEFEKTAISFRQFMDESLKIMGMKAHEKGIELAYQIAPDIPDRIQGDPVRLRQVLLNLVDNAIKFTKKGEVIVSAAAQSQTDYEVMLDIAVTDTGIGIPEDKQRSIFGAYSQGDPSTLREYGGTGLGLSVSAQLVDLMGGKIKLKSQPSRGSSFRFTAGFMIQQNGEGHKTEDAHPDLVGLSAMVVDDNESVRKITTKILEGLQIKVVAVSSPQEARELLSKSQVENTPFDLILIDSDMPETDGFSLAEWIIDHQISDADIIMLLSFPHLKRKAELEVLGISTSIVKPFGALELEGIILRARGIKKPESELTANTQKRAVRIPSRPLKILVAEDTAFNQKFIQRLLGRWNHHVKLVGNGHQALEALRNKSFDIVLMDVQMPHLNGLEATKTIRLEEQQSKNHIPIIAMTAHAIRGDRERCLEAGMDEYISKPIDSDKLFDAIEKLTGGSHTLDKKEDESSAIDKATLLKAFDGDWNFFKEVVDVFLDDYPKLIDDLRRADKETDSNTLMRAAHSLKGMLKNFQAEPAAEVAFKLETQGKAGNFDAVAETIEYLAGQIAGVDKNLRGILGEQFGQI